MSDSESDMSFVVSDEEYEEPKKGPKKAAAPKKAAEPKEKKAAEPKEKKPAAPKKAAEPKEKASPKPKAAAKPKAPKKPKDDDDDDDDDIYNDDDDDDGYGTVAKKASSSKKGGASNGDRPVEEVYQKKTQLEHILLRPDTYIGSVEAITQLLWVLEGEAMVQKQVTFVPGLYKIFDEILVNAADNKVRDPSMSNLKVTIDAENNLISVYNDGRGIPVEIHKEEQVYVPELIFGHLLTSSNYNDDEKKVTGGRNGYGAKLCNIFSTEFTVETAYEGKKFKQVFKNNMSEKSKPVIGSCKDDFTRITFKPDLSKFGLTRIEPDFEALFKKRVYDMAGCLKDIKVFLNDERIKIKGFKQYCELFLSERPQPAPIVVHEIVNDRWEVCATVGDAGQLIQVSFVNSICTYKGGTHVNYIVDQVASSLLESINKKSKSVTLKPQQVKNNLCIFINCLIENPTFDSQTKENMTLKASAFGSKAALSTEFMKKMTKTGIIENILSWAKFKESELLKKSDGSKKQRVSGISKLDDANMAGTKKAHLCSLILTEGDSAKALAVSGLSVVGRDYYGVFPLRGKLLNVREATHKQLMENQEILNLKKIMGLQNGKTYEDATSLRYGHLMIMTDQDHDGSHIKGLIINFLDFFFPSLLKIPGFLVEFITPIVKVSKGKKGKSFFTIPEYEQWKEENDNGKGWTVKYYKGLGTSSSEEAKEYFSDMNQHKKVFAACDQEGVSAIDLAFSKKKADDRKEWLRNFKEGTYIDHSVDEIEIPTFINKELILFSMADNVRSIPSVVDGLKPGHRKILFSCFKRNLKTEIKVAQLSGYIAEHSAYHHGEQSLNSTIIGMAQNYVGSNNINYLEPRGQFGTRLQGGKDAASSRYVFTTLSPITREIFHPSDSQLLDYLDDDGQSIEPRWYMPVLPMILLNGGEGIGTGWSTYIPNYNPKDIISNLRKLIRKEEIAPMHPWYRGFVGAIEEQGTGKYKVTGVWNVSEEANGFRTLEITELPVGSWTQPYKDFLEGLVDQEKGGIKEFREYHTDTTVHFQIKMTAAQYATAEAEGIEKKFKLSTSISTTNMVCFDQEGRIKKYAAVEEILREFFELRLEHYSKRKEYLVGQLTKEHQLLSNKARFIMEIIEGKLVISNKKKAEVITLLRSRKYYEDEGKKKADTQAPAEDEEDEEDTTTKGFNYLLEMSISNLTFEKVQKLLNERDNKEKELNVLLDKTPAILWETDLDVVMIRWDEILEADENIKKKTTSKKAANSKGKSAAARKPAAKAKKPMDSDDDDDRLNDFIVDDDDEDDYEDHTKKSAPSKSRAAPAKAAPAKAAPVKMEEDDDDLPIASKVTKAATAKAAPAKAAAAKAAPAKPAAKSKKGSDDDDDDDFQIIMEKAAPKPKAAPSKAKKVVSDDESEGEVKKPAPKPRAQPKAKKGSDDEDDKKPAPKPKAPPKAKKAVSDDDDDDDDVKPALSLADAIKKKKTEAAGKAQPSITNFYGKAEEKKGVRPRSESQTPPGPPAKKRNVTKKKYVDSDDDNDDDGSDYND